MSTPHAPGPDEADLAAISARWAHAASGPWCDDVDGENGVLRVWFRETPGDDIGGFPAGYDLTVACVVFPGDMETYEGSDFRTARALSQAPSDIATLLAEVRRLRPIAALLEDWGTLRAEYRRLRGRQDHVPTADERAAAMHRLGELDGEIEAAFLALREVSDRLVATDRERAARSHAPGPAELTPQERAYGLLLSERLALEAAALKAQDDMRQAAREHAALADVAPGEHDAGAQAREG